MWDFSIQLIAQWESIILPKGRTNFVKVWLLEIHVNEVYSGFATAVHGFYTFPSMLQCLSTEASVTLNSSG